MVVTVKWYFVPNTWCGHKIYVKSLAQKPSLRKWILGFWSGGKYFWHCLLLSWELICSGTNLLLPSTGNSIENAGAAVRNRGEKEEVNWDFSESHHLQFSSVLQFSYKNSYLPTMFSYQVTSATVGCCLGLSFGGWLRSLVGCSWTPTPKSSPSSWTLSLSWSWHTRQTWETGYTFSSPGNRG